MGFMVGEAFRKFLPHFDRVFIRWKYRPKFNQKGIMLPEKSQGKVLQATIVGLKMGSKGKSRKI